jgi:hypothetical protein
MATPCTTVSRVGRRRVDVREAREVVERVDQVLHQLGLRARARLLRSFAVRPAVVVVLGGEAQVLVPLLLELSLQVVVGPGRVGRRPGRHGGIVGSRRPAVVEVGRRWWAGRERS